MDEIVLPGKFKEENQLAVGMFQPVVIEEQVLDFIVQVLIFMFMEWGPGVFDFTDREGIGHAFQDHVIVQVAKVADIKDVICHFAEKVEIAVIFDKCPLSRIHGSEFKIVDFSPVLFDNTVLLDDQRLPGIQSGVLEGLVLILK
jgi:hypothetical protein